MKRYIAIYRQLLRMNALTLLVYPANFVNSMLATIGWGFFSLFSVVILTSRTQEVFGWQRQELLLLNGYYGLVIGVFHVFFSRNLERFSTVIHYGQLDTVLTKPIDSQFALSLWMFNYTSLARIVIAFWYLAYVNDGFFPVTDPIKAGEFMLVSICSLVLLYSIWYMMITVTIWFTKLSNVVELMYSVTGMARYPQEMYAQLSWYIFAFLVPLTLIITTPAKILIRQADMRDLALLVVLASLFFVCSRKFWAFALRFYSSASS